MFAGHPSLRYGDVVHFMELWGKSSGNTVIFTGTCPSFFENCFHRSSFLACEQDLRKEPEGDWKGGSGKKDGS